MYRYFINKVILYIVCLNLLAGYIVCRSKEASTGKAINPVKVETPVTVTTTNTAPLSDSVELNAASNFI